MKITGFETIPVRGQAMILKMFTDEGLVGYGEPMNYEHWRVVAQAVEDMAEYLMGKDPTTAEIVALCAGAFPEQEGTPVHLQEKAVTHYT